MASRHREEKIIATVACPLCGAATGARCRNPEPHQAWRGPVDHRPQPLRCHTERRLAWLTWKRPG